MSRAHALRVVSLLSGVAVLAVAVSMLLRKPSLSQVAHRGLHALQNGDAHALMPLLSREEVRQMSLDEEKVRRLLQSYVIPVYAACAPEGPPLEEGSTNGSMTARQLYTTARRTRAGQFCTAYLTPDGIMCINCISRTIQDTMVAKHLQTDELRRAGFWSRARATRARSRSLGTNGMMVEGRGFMTWNQLLEYYQSRLRLQAS